MYSGTYGFDDLKTFCKEKLGPSCGPKRLDLCDAETQKQIKIFQSWKLDKLDAEIKKGEEGIIAAEELWIKQEKDLKAEYKAMKTKMFDDMKKIKKSGLERMVQVLLHHRSLNKKQFMW